jgi:hypothetical protein
MYTLFVATDRRNSAGLCPGSTICVEMARDLPSVDVQRVVPSTAPAWLSGTPTLVDEHGQTLCGYAAIMRVHEEVVRAAVGAAVGAVAVASATKAKRENHKTLARPSPPPSAAADDDAWTSRIDEEEDDEDDDSSTHKLTQADLERMTARKAPENGPSVAAPPMPQQLTD